MKPQIVDTLHQHDTSSLEHVQNAIHLDVIINVDVDVTLLGDA